MEIRSQYDIPVRTRECMNTLSKYRLHIANMRREGMSTKEIAAVFGIDITSEKVKNRLNKAIHRYYTWLMEGRWGTFMNYMNNE